MMTAMSSGRMIELVAAVLILGAGIFFYRRRDPGGEGYGSQGAVIMFVIGAIMGAHALGAFNYHPTKAEAEYFKEHGQ
jgi:hypothetical protein